MDDVKIYRIHHIQYLLFMVQEDALRPLKTRPSWCLLRLLLCLNKHLLRHCSQHTDLMQIIDVLSLIHIQGHIHSAPYPPFVFVSFCLCKSFQSLYVIMSFCLRILKSPIVQSFQSLYVIMSFCLRTLKSPIVQCFQSLYVIMSFCLRRLKALFNLSPLS